LSNGFGDDGGPLYGRIGYAAATVVGLAFVVVGLKARSRNPSFGDTLVILGLAPGFVLILMFWFPPVALVGLGAIVAAGFALRDASAGADEAPSQLS
jgi:hypothetical protein